MFAVGDVMFFEGYIRLKGWETLN